MNRGRRREDIFFTDADREEFIKVLRESADLWNLRISAYCLHVGRVSVGSDQGKMLRLKE